MRPATKLAQVGVGWDRLIGSISVPIYRSASFRHPGLGQSTGFDYSRTGNPTRQVLEESIASLEGGYRGLAFASGMAAIAGILSLFKPGDHLLVSDDLYGGTYRLLTTVGAGFGLKFSFIDFTDPEALLRGIKGETKAILVETPTNPLMKIVDIQAVADFAGSRQLMLIVDNTFLTPYLQRPLDLGADLVVHSATKYLGGHNDVVVGLIVSKSEELGEKMAVIQNTVGAVPGPEDCWLLLRGMKTLAVRIEWAQKTACRLAAFLQRHPAVAKVYYPGLPEHPGHELCRRQAQGFGAMISFEVKYSEMVPDILARLSIISFAESLGGVESLITYPETQTHSDIPVEVRRRRGITDRLLRLSVGLEDPEDLEADLAGALG